MIIGITGATGFVGRHLLAAAKNAGHAVVGFSRTPQPRAGFVEMRAWQPLANADFSGLDAVIHLAGENLLGLWTKRKREAIRRTRVISPSAPARSRVTRPFSTAPCPNDGLAISEHPLLVPIDGL